jgi:hypothetical protein
VNSYRGEVAMSRAYEVVREQLGFLASLRLSLEDSMMMEVSELIDWYRELKEEDPLRISEDWIGLCHEIDDLCKEYAYPALCTEITGGSDELA